MTQARVTLQYFVTALMAYVVGKGWLPQDVATEIGALIVTLLPALYSIWKSCNQGKIDAAANVPGVKIVAPDEIANAIPKANVLPASEHEVAPK